MSYVVGKIPLYQRCSVTLNLAGMLLFNDELKPFYLRRMELNVEAGCLLCPMRVIVPKHLQDFLLKELHLRHPGVSRMQSIALCYLWWPGLDKEIEKLVATCTACQAVRQAPAAAPLHPLDMGYKTLICTIQFSILSFCRNSATRKEKDKLTCRLSRP